jgi:hypothetical protein
MINLILAEAEEVSLPFTPFKPLPLSLLFVIFANPLVGSSYYLGISS